MRIKSDTGWQHIQNYNLVLLTHPIVYKCADETSRKSKQNKPNDRMKRTIAVPLTQNSFRFCCQMYRCVTHTLATI